MSDDACLMTQWQPLMPLLTALRSPQRHLQRFCPCPRPLLRYQPLRCLLLVLYIFIPFRPHETAQLLTKRVVAPSLRSTSGVADLMIHNCPLLETTIKPLNHDNDHQNNYCFH